MNSSSSGKRLENFLSGKGFYIVLFLCAAVIGASAWMMAAGNAAMEEDAIQTSADSENRRVETVIIPASPNKGKGVTPELEEEAPPVSGETLIETEAPAEEPAVPAEAPAPVWVWPVSGEIGRSYSRDTLSYDVTMRDWRVHEGLDILAEPGTPVLAASSGTVESVRTDDLLGVVVVLDHGGGRKSVYANLQEDPAVQPGQWVEAGQIVGAVGKTAYGEISQEPHLHFSMEADGRSVDPVQLLPG